MKKLGFTLVELLLCILIIGLVSTMGTVVIKKNVEKAYNMYYYTGFVNLYNALMDTVERNGQTEKGYKYNNSYDCTISTSDITCHLNNLLGTGDLAQGSNVITAKNGIAYEMTQAGLDYYLSGLHYSADHIQNTHFITMKIPTPKTRNNAAGIIDVPIDILGVGNGKFYVIPNNDIILNRSDLLPVYFDDGISGRADTNGEIKPVHFYNYASAICGTDDFRNLEQKLKGDRSDIVYAEIQTAKTNICTSNVVNANSNDADNGVIKFADPRKAR